MLTDNSADGADRLSPDPFVLPRKFYQKVASCPSEKCSGKIRYLWLHLSDEALAANNLEIHEVSSLSLESWLNVLDEAASLGGEWVVVSLERPSSHFPMLWTLFDWAQKTHNMNIALHMNKPMLCPDDHSKLLGLDRCHSFLFVPTSHFDLYRHFSEAGLMVKSCDPEVAEMELCSMPGNMLFVSSAGKIYTCGMVHGDEDYLLGDINDGFFGDIICNSAVPHAVGKAAMRRENGCMGCPPLVLKSHA